MSSDDDPCVPTGLPPDGKKWKVRDLKTFLVANKEVLEFEEQEFDQIIRARWNGRDFLELIKSESNLSAFSISDGAKKRLARLSEWLRRKMGE